MHNKKEVESKKINLKGILIGNGLIGVNENLTYNVHDFLFSHHITSYENRMDFNKYCLILISF